LNFGVLVPALVNAVVEFSYNPDLCSCDRALNTTEPGLISVVDDDPSLVEGIVSLLESVGHIAVGYCSAEDFLASNDVSRTACLILDVRMPGMSGLELQQRLASNGNHTPVVFVTAHGGHDVSAEALSRGAVAFLRKPFSQDSLLDAVRSVLWVKTNMNQQPLPNGQNHVNGVLEKPNTPDSTAGTPETVDPALGPAAQVSAAGDTEDHASPETAQVTQVLQALGRSEAGAAEKLLPLVYAELRRLAAARMAHEMSGQTLQPTALVHEAWLRLVKDGDRTWQNRAHFFGAAAEAMRRILIERARHKSRLKHGGGQARFNIEDVELAETTPDDKVLLVDEALARLKIEDPELERIVVLKFFGGLSNAEIAQSLGLANRTLDRQWAYAKAWLFRTIGEQM
jgi:RNA polymerase sigma factor (TIGR02999 family)